MRKVIVLLCALSVFAMANPSNAGVLKWAGRGAVACALTQPCRGAIGGGMLKGGGLAVRRYAPQLLSKCLHSPKCVALLDRALAAAAGTAAATAAWKSLDMWMAANGSDDEAPSPGVSTDDQTASIMPDPEDPFDDDSQEQKEIEFKPSRKSLQHAYARHSEHWGFTQNPNNKVLAEYEATLRRFMRAPGTLVKKGLYRGDPVTHFYNRTTNMWLSVRPDGNLAAAFRLSDTQLEYLETISKVSSLTDWRKYA